MLIYLIKGDGELSALSRFLGNNWSFLECCFEHKYKPTEEEKKAIAYLTRLNPCVNGQDCDQEFCKYILTLFIDRLFQQDRMELDYKIRMSQAAWKFLSSIQILEKCDFRLILEVYWLSTQLISIIGIYGHHCPSVTYAGGPNKSETIVCLQQGCRFGAEDHPPGTKIKHPRQERWEKSDGSYTPYYWASLH